MAYGFTIHFATINTSFISFSPINLTLFTIHFATINTEKWNEFKNYCIHLQYTLLLLIRHHI